MSEMPRLIGKRELLSLVPYTIQHIYRMHDTALSCVATIMRVNERD